MQERNALDAQINAILGLEQGLKDNLEFAELAESEGDAESLDSVQAQLKLLKETAGKAETEALLSGEADKNDCFLEIHPGAGGTESNDWASMLLRMYVRWAQKSGFKVDVIEQQAGDEAGVKSATIQVKGLNAYGWLKTESGVHRLVRISPFDSNARRHTSFASVWVYPVIDDTIEIDVKESDCRIDTFRSSGAGGQHVNTTDSAVRITHIPTNIVVQCQNERSQHKNRASAWKMLRAKMAQMEEDKREAQEAAARGQQAKTGFGSQIRNYFLHPDQRVKDTRTKYQQGNFHAALDGDIQGFLEAVLRWRAGQPVEDDGDDD